jgi:hypothetical protein
MPLYPAFLDLMQRASRALGFETIDGFPPGHIHARTRWDRAYFDIASDVKPDQIEHAICEAIANTPLVFGRIVNPTPRMQRAVLGIIDARLRGAGGAPADLVRLLIEAYRSPDTIEAIPGLRAAIAATGQYEMPVRVVRLLDYLADMPSAFDVIDAGAGRAVRR